VQGQVLSGMVQDLDHSRLPVVGMILALMAVLEELAQLEVLKQVVAKKHLPKVPLVLGLRPLLRVAQTVSVAPLAVAPLE